MEKIVLDGVYYHNVGRVEKTPLGNKISRYPEELEKVINSNARFMSRYSCGCELRFVSEAPRILISVISEISDGDVTVFCGDFQYEHRTLKRGEVTNFNLCPPSVFSRVNAAYTDGKAFSHKVWRLMFHNCIATVVSVDAFGFEIRPPYEEEQPSKTMLAYGSSITHGAGAALQDIAYVEHLARLLGCDILPKGVGGACFCEKEIADWFAEKPAWDFAYLELGINMQGSFSVEEFDQRADYFVKTMLATGKPIFLTNIYPYSADFDFVNTKEKAKLDAYRETLRKIARKYACDTLFFFEGSDVLKDTSYLTCDGVHPSTFGHIRMAENLYDLMKDKLHF